MLCRREPPLREDAWQRPWTLLATAIASVSDCAGHGSRRSLPSGAPETRRICCRENVALLRGGDFGRRLRIARDVPRLFQLWPRPLRRNAPRVLDGCCHTTPAPPANLHSLLGSRRPGGSRLLKQARPDLL